MKRILPIFAVVFPSLRALAVAEAYSGGYYGYSGFRGNSGYSGYYHGGYSDYYSYYYVDGYTYGYDASDTTYYGVTSDAVRFDTADGSPADLGFDPFDTGVRADFGRTEGGCHAAGVVGGWASLGGVVAVLATWLQARRPGGREEG